jgi:hypothetical protein
VRQDRIGWQWNRRVRSADLFDEEVVMSPNVQTECSYQPVAPERYKNRTGDELRIEVQAVGPSRYGPGMMAQRTVELAVADGETFEIDPEDRAAWLAGLASRGEPNPVLRGQVELLGGCTEMAFLQAIQFEARQRASL